MDTNGYQSSVTTSNRKMWWYEGHLNQCHHTAIQLIITISINLTTYNPVWYTIRTSVAVIAAQLSLHWCNSDWCKELKSEHLQKAYVRVNIYTIKQQMWTNFVAGQILRTVIHFLLSTFHSVPVYKKRGAGQQQNFVHNYVMSLLWWSHTYWN